jgi:hypothetical protein
MKRVLGVILLGLVSCKPGVVYSEMSIDFFFDKWWELDKNSFFDDGTCFHLNSEDQAIRVHYPGYKPEVGYIEGYWTLEEDYVFIEDVYGFDISLWPYGQCGDYTVIVSSSIIEQKSKLYECEF